jgi:beta-1,4-mannosyl-glycoprotein beta-1,4-N-acetylglucosaminyltransferase
MIIDTFPFNKDFNALEIRYEELKEVVDLFVASESMFTHSGLKKDLHLSKAIDVLGKMEDKLVVLPSRKKPLTRNPRTREMLQRQEITKYLRSLDLLPTDLIIHSDCDEIPRASVIRELSRIEKEVDALLELDNYANYLNAQDGVWLRGRVQSWGKFRSIQHMRADIFIHNSANHRRHNLPVMRLTDFWSTRRFPLNRLPEFIRVNTLQIYQNAGWHFNNLFSEDEIIRKIESSCHTEWNTFEVRRNAIVNFKNAADIYTGKSHEIVEIDSSFPACIQKDIRKWSKFIFANI